jgi:hypothetical protein
MNKDLNFHLLPRFRENFYWDIYSILKATRNIKKNNVSGEKSAAGA